MTLNIYLIFDGNCREAVEYYAETFDTPMKDILTFGDMKTKDWTPPAGTENLIMHTWLDIQGAMVMFSDNTPGMPMAAGDNFSLTLIGQEDELRRLFEKMKSDGGQATMEIQETEWSPAYGMLKDKFGIPWMFNTEEKQG